MTKIGYLDLMGNYILNVREHFIDYCKEENIGYFKKKAYHEKMNEIRISLLTTFCNLLFGISNVYRDNKGDKQH
jgi:hypothetical protein